MPRGFAIGSRQWVSVYLVCSRRDRAERISELLQDYGVESLASSRGFGEESFEAGLVKIVQGTLGNGFFWPAEKLAVAAEEEIFERRSRGAGKNRLPAYFLARSRTFTREISLFTWTTG